MFFEATRTLVDETMSELGTVKPASFGGVIEILQFIEESHVPRFVWVKVGSVQDLVQKLSDEAFQHNDDTRTVAGSFFGGIN